MTDVTSKALWSTSKTSVLQTTTTPGQIRGITRGEADVRVTYREGGVDVISAEKRVLVLEPGTFKVSGTVTASTTGGGLDFVRIAIASGTGAGIYAFTDSAGEYALYGAAGEITLRASLDGFEPMDQRLQVSSEARADFALASAASVDIAGAWTMTFSASPGCRANLPPEAHDRQFDATLTQQGAQVVIELSGPTLVNEPWSPRPFKTPGSLLGDVLSFTIIGDTGYDTWSFVDLYDHFGPNQWWGVEGAIRGTVSGSEIRAVMDGDLEYWTGARPAGMPIGVCRANDHTVILRRR